MSISPASNPLGVPNQPPAALSTSLTATGQAPVGTPPQTPLFVPVLAATILQVSNVLIKNPPQAQDTTRTFVREPQKVSQRA